MIDRCICDRLDSHSDTNFWFQGKAADLQTTCDPFPLDQGTTTLIMGAHHLLPNHILNKCTIQRRLSQDLTMETRCDHLCLVHHLTYLLEEIMLVGHRLLPMLHLWYGIFFLLHIYLVRRPLYCVLLTSSIFHRVRNQIDWSKRRRLNRYELDGMDWVILCSPSTRLVNNGLSLYLF